MSNRIYDNMGMAYEIKTYSGKVKKVYRGGVVQVKIHDERLCENYRVGYVHSVRSTKEHDVIVIYPKIDKYRFSGQSMEIPEHMIVDIIKLLNSRGYIGTRH